MSQESHVAFNTLPIGAAFHLRVGGGVWRKLTASTAARLGSRVSVDHVTFDEERCCRHPELDVAAADLRAIYYGRPQLAEQGGTQSTVHKE